MSEIIETICGFEISCYSTICQNKKYFIYYRPKQQYLCYYGLDSTCINGWYNSVEECRLNITNWINNMKTFKVVCVHEHVRQAIINHFKYLGYDLKNCSNVYRAYCVKQDKVVIGCDTNYDEDNFPKITLDVFFSMPNNEYRLDDNHVAKIEKDRVTIGCRTFTKETMVGFAKEILKVMGE